MSACELLDADVAFQRRAAQYGIKAATKGWVGLGWHELGEMGHDMRYTDIVVGLFNDNGTV